MVKKILFLVLDILLTIIICICVFKGVNIGNIHILSIKDIQSANDELTNTIASANEKNLEFENEIKTVKTNTEALAKAKKAYLDLVTISTDSEIQEALQTKNYSIEYLWSQVGNHATKEGVVTKMEITSSSVGDAERRNLNFTASGTYLAITNFISDLENDSDLDFTIDNFDMTDGKATFVVKDVKIKKENTSVQSNNAPSVKEDTKNSSSNKEEKTSTAGEENKTEESKSTDTSNTTNE